MCVLLTCCNICLSFVYRPSRRIFDVQFLEMVHSEYSSLVSLRSGMSQSSILSSRINDQDRMDEVSDSLSANPDHRIFPENPLMLGFYLDCVRNGKLANTTSCSCWIKVLSCTLNRERQCVLYK